MAGINSKIATGAGWMISLRWVDRLISLIAIAILARLLTPADFGLVAYAMVAVEILNQFLMFSFETVLIRDQDGNKDRYNAVWTLEIIKGAIVCVLLIALSGPIARFFGEPDVEQIIYWVSFIPLIKGVANIGTVDFQRNLTFDKEFYLRTFARLGSSIVTVFLAVVLKSFWALIYGAIFRVILHVMLSYIMSDYRPKLSLAGSSKVLAFSMWLLIQNAFLAINSRLPVIVIGRFFEAQALAFFNMATELTSLMTGQLAAPIRRALYPGIAKMQEDAPQMASTLKSVLGVIVFIGLPATIGIGVTAPLLVPVVLGGNWSDVVPIIQLLSLATALLMFYPNVNVVTWALGRPKITAMINGVRVGLLIPALLFAVPEFGVLGAAGSILAVNAIILVVDYVVVTRLTTLTMSDVISATWRSTLAVILMAIGVTYVLTNPMLVTLFQSRVLHLAACVVAGMASYGLAVTILWFISGMPGGAEKHALRVLSASIRRVRGNVSQRIVD